MVETYQKCTDRLKTGGSFPKKHILDNEISEKYKKAVEKNGMHWELVTVGMHWRNVAEKATQTFKGNFKSILCGVATNFPLNKWDTLLPQAELTCNLLHQSNIAPNMSYQAYTFGTHDFNGMPLAPLGCAVTIHEKSSKYRTWAVHSVDGWYLGTLEKYYRCFDVWVKGTGAVRSTDTVSFKHKHITNPTVTPA